MGARGWHKHGDDGDDDFVVDGAVLKQETDGAVLVEVGGEDLWLPKSQVRSREDLTEPGDVGSVTIPLWLARDRIASAEFTSRARAASGPAASRRRP